MCRLLYFQGFEVDSRNLDDSDRQLGLPELTAFASPVYHSPFEATRSGTLGYRMRLTLPASWHQNPGSCDKFISKTWLKVQSTCASASCHTYGRPPV